MPITKSFPHSVVVRDHITPCLHVKEWWPNGSKAWDAIIRKSAGSKWRLSPGEGITETQAATCGEDTDIAVSGKQALSSNSLK